MSKVIDYLFEHRNSSAHLAVGLAIAAGVITAAAAVIFLIEYFSH